MTDDCWPPGKVCRHGSLARSCDRCDYERELAEQAAKAENLRARASQAERSLATVTAERDEAVSKLAEAERGYRMRGYSHDFSPGVYQREADSLRAQLAKTEAVVGPSRLVMRMLEALIQSPALDGADLRDESRACDALDAALRALDSPVGVAATAETETAAVATESRLQYSSPMRWDERTLLVRDDDGLEWIAQTDDVVSCLRTNAEAGRDVLFALMPSLKRPKRVLCDHPPDPQAPATRADVAAMIAEERERVLRVVDAYREDSAGDADDAQLLLGDIVDALRKAGKP